MTKLPPPIRRHFRKRSPAQQAAIERSKELRVVRRAGGGRAAAGAVLGPVTEPDMEWTRKAETNPLVDLSKCALCGFAIGRKRAAWYLYALAHVTCVHDWLSKLGFSPALIACEMAIRSRLAREIQGRVNK